MRKIVLFAQLEAIQKTLKKLRSAAEQRDIAVKSMQSLFETDYPNGEPFKKAVAHFRELDKKCFSLHELYTEQEKNCKEQKKRAARASDAVRMAELGRNQSF